MKKFIVCFAQLCFFVPVMLMAQKSAGSRPCMPCEQLKKLQLPDVTILEAKSIKNDTIDGQLVTAPTCRILGRISKEINFELLLPATWNKRFLMSGGGGFVGSIQNSFRWKVNEGYATVGTDAGHQASGIDAKWALNNMERQLNFGRLAIHLTAIVSKSVIHTYYCKEPVYSYFAGCSRGGGQAMMEAQQYPEDFDGIVAGAPAFSWPAIGAKFIQNSQQIFPDASNLNKYVITRDNLRLLQEQVLKQCDAIDGINDHIINDPRDCKLGFSMLPVCPDSASHADCFTAQQLAAIKTVYAACTIQKDTIYPGFPYGGENEPGSWDIWIAGNHPSMTSPSLQYMFGTNMFKYLVFNNPSWDYLKYDFSNFFETTRYASAYLDATDTNYAAFKKRKRKMIMYHGWNDPALSAYATIKHYENVEKADKDIQSYIRLFLLPGVLHCDGGPGPDEADWIKLIRDWVENDKAPERVVLSKKEKDKVVMTRPSSLFRRLPFIQEKEMSILRKTLWIRSDSKHYKYIFFNKLKCMITRVWHGRTKIADAENYLQFLLTKGTREYADTTGNISIKVWSRKEADCCHFYTVTEWIDLASIKLFAGDDYEKAVYYPEDDGFLLEFEEKVQHYESYDIAGKVSKF